MRFINLQENPSPWTLATISDLEGTFYASTLPLDYIEGSQKDEVKQYFKLGKDLLEILRLTLTQKTTLSWSLLKVNADTRFYPQYRNQPGDNPDIELQRKIYNLSSLLSIKEGSLQITEHPLMKARYTTSKYNPEKKLFDTEAYKETESTISNCQPQDGDFSWCNLKNLSGFLTLLKENYKPNELQKASPSPFELHLSAIFKGEAAKKLLEELKIDNSEELSHLKRFITIENAIAFYSLQYQAAHQLEKIRQFARACNANFGALRLKDSTNTFSVEALVKQIETTLFPQGFIMLLNTKELVGNIETMLKELAKPLEGLPYFRENIQYELAILPDSKKTFSTLQDKCIAWLKNILSTYQLTTTEDSNRNTVVFYLLFFVETHFLALSRRLIFIEDVPMQHQNVARNLAMIDRQEEYNQLIQEHIAKLESEPTPAVNLPLSQELVDREPTSSLAGNMVNTFLNRYSDQQSAQATKENFLTITKNYTTLFSLLSSSTPINKNEGTAAFRTIENEGTAGAAAAAAAAARSS